MPWRGVFPPGHYYALKDRRAFALQLAAERLRQRRLVEPVQQRGGALRLGGHAV